MRLSIDCRMWYSAGIGTYLRNIVPRIISLLPDAKICLIGPVGDYEDVPSGRVELVECIAPIYSIGEQIELPRKIPKSDLFFSPQYNIPLLYRGTQVTTIHDIFHIAQENEDNSPTKKFYARTMLSAALRKSRIVFTDSRFTLSEMRKYNLPCLEKVEVIYLGASLDRSVEASYDASRDRKHILFVGNVKPHKNLKRLVAAYKVLHTQYSSSVPLLIVGELDNFITGMPGFKEEINESRWGDWIRFTGRCTDNELTEAYRHARVLVLPSMYEGFGLPPLEAMACGCPVLVSHAASLPEICGNAALYCDPYSVDDIAKKLHELLVDDHLREKLVNNGFKQVATFSWTKAATAFVDSLLEVVN